MKELIKKLVEVPSPSGYENQIRAVIQTEVEPYANQVRVDALGNLIASYGQEREGGLRIMLSAHMDEIGIIVTHIDERGFLRFTAIGGVSPRTCIGSRVRFLKGQNGIIYSERMEDLTRMPSMDQLYIDIGASKREDVPLRVGDMGVFDRPFVDLGERLVSKAMDDRIAAAIQIETLRRLAEEKVQLEHQVFFVFSVQEEVGVRGATTAAYWVNPDLGVAVDVTATGDTPKGLKMDVRLGAGPAIKVRDAGMLADPRVVDWMVTTAEKAGLPYQMEVLEGGSTDARAMQLARAGVPAGCLSVPCRYIHSPSEMVDYQDVQNSVSLLVELLKNPVDLR
jgi:tetrahedral aminopeptidase